MLCNDLLHGAAHGRDILIGIRLLGHLDVLHPDLLQLFSRQRLQLCLRLIGELLHTSLADLQQHLLLLFRFLQPGLLE